MNRAVKLIVFSVLTLLAMSSCSNGNNVDAVLENIHSRKSVREFTSEPVSDADIQTMLKAAMAAPTAINFQPWRFVVVNEREALDSLADQLPYAKMLKQAPLAIVVCGETLWMGGEENPFWSLERCPRSSIYSKASLCGSDRPSGRRKPAKRQVES